MNPIKFTIPIETPNPSNGSRGKDWAVRERKRNQRKTAKQVTTWALPEGGKIKTITIKKILLTRVAPSNGLDEFDNLGSALKSVADGIADALGCKNDRVLPWDKKQRRGAQGEHSVEVEITFKTGVK